jgi:hypothetical protein
MAIVIHNLLSYLFHSLVRVKVKEAVRLLISQHAYVLVLGVGVVVTAQDKVRKHRQQASTKQAKSNREN